MHDYLGCIKAVDESVGRLLKYLDDEGLAENTIVVYSSDQGFYLGEHGWFDKRWIFEESLRTPLLVRWPGVVKPGSVNDDLVSNLDFAETFLDAAGLPVPAEMQGRSLVPVLKGRTPADWRKSFYYHYYEYPAPHHVRPHYGVVTRGTSWSTSTGPTSMPGSSSTGRRTRTSCKSVYDDPAYAGVVADLKRELGRLRAELKCPRRAARGSLRTDPRRWSALIRPAGRRPIGPSSSGSAEGEERPDDRLTIGGCLRSHLTL